MCRSIRSAMCVCFFILFLCVSASAQIPPGYNPNLNVPIPTPFIPDIKVPVPSVPNIKVPSPGVPDIPNIKMPEPHPVTIPTHTFPTPVPFNPVPNHPFGNMPAPTVDYRVFTNVSETGPTPEPRRGKEGYDEAMAYFSEGRYYSARKAFTESRYEDWQDWADKCPQPKPATGELWHDPALRLQDTELTIRVDQSSTDMFFRIYKEDSLISDVYITGSDEVTVFLPGNAYYTVKDGIGRTWYGEKEAFGKEGTYETMTFDGKGTERVFLESGYAYTLSINVTDTGGGTDVDSRSESWENFSE